MVAATKINRLHDATCLVEGFQQMLVVQVDL